MFATIRAGRLARRPALVPCRHHRLRPIASGSRSCGRQQDAYRVSIGQQMQRTLRRPPGLQATARLLEIQALDASSSWLFAEIPAESQPYEPGAARLKAAWWQAAAPSEASPHNVATLQKALARYVAPSVRQNPFTPRPGEHGLPFEDARGAMRGVVGFRSASNGRRTWSRASSCWGAVLPVVDYEGMVLPDPSTPTWVGRRIDRSDVFQKARHSAKAWRRCRRRRAGAPVCVVRSASTGGPTPMAIGICGRRLGDRTGVALKNLAILAVGALAAGIAWLMASASSAGTGAAAHRASSSRRPGRPWASARGLTADWRTRSTLDWRARGPARACRGAQGR
jgi:hypothetical protein